jgi:hypothetical protein
MSIEVFRCLEKMVKEHYRGSHRVKKPIPVQWGKKPSSRFIEESIAEGRESLTEIKARREFLKSGRSSH